MAVGKKIRKKVPKPGERRPEFRPGERRPEFRPGARAGFEFESKIPNLLPALVSMDLKNIEKVHGAFNSAHDYFRNASEGLKDREAFVDSVLRIDYALMHSPARRALGNDLQTVNEKVKRVKELIEKGDLNRAHEEFNTLFEVRVSKDERTGLVTTKPGPLRLAISKLEKMKKETEDKIANILKEGKQVKKERRGYL